MSVTPDSWQAIAEQLKTSAWDIVADWLLVARDRLAAQRPYVTLTDEQLVAGLPTIVGGVARVVADPAVLANLDPQDALRTVAEDLGRSRYRDGYKIDTLLADFSLLRSQMARRCAAIANGSHTPELQTRINAAVDLMLQATVTAYHAAASADLIELANKDRLTCCLNLKALMRLLGQEVVRARRYRQPLALAIIDIDRFREFNLAHGRLEGNRVLADIGRTVIQSIRGGDQAARLGGDEFAVVLPHTGREPAGVVGERIRREVRRQPIAETGVTVSIGLAAYPDHADDAEQLLGQARTALSQAQRDGGDVTITLP